MSLSVVVVNWNSGSFLGACLESLRITTPGADIVVVDNASADSSLEAAEGFLNQVDVVRNSVNRGFAAAVNQGFAETSATYVLILNPDVRVLPGAIKTLAAFLEAHPKAGAIGGYVNDKYLPRDLPTAATLIGENLGLSSRRRQSRPVDVVAVDQPAAAALMIRRDAYDDIGGFDERFYPAWYEDVDFCRRLKSSGWELYFSPEAEFQHAGGYSVDKLGPAAFLEAYYQNQLRYAQKHLGGAAQLGVRASIAAGMLIRMATKPPNARAYIHVLRKAIGGWRK